MIPRILENRISEKINGGLVIVLLGARQVGKSNPLKSILKDLDYLLLINKVNFRGFVKI